MKIDLTRVIWTAVISATSGVAGLVCAVTGVSLEVVVSLGFVSVASALLASREG